MISDTVLNVFDSVSDLRLKLDSLRALYGAFCTYSDLEAEAAIFAQTVRYHADEIQLLSHAFFTLLCSILEDSKEAEKDAAKALEEAKKAEPLPDKEAALKTIYATFTLEEKKSLCRNLYNMTA